MGLDTDIQAHHKSQASLLPSLKTVVQGTAHCFLGAWHRVVPFPRAVLCGQLGVAPQMSSGGTTEINRQAL